MKLRDFKTNTWNFKVMKYNAMTIFYIPTYSNT